MSTLYTKIPRTTLWLLEEGDFTMGGRLPDAKPAFEGYVAPIYIGKTVITNEQYEAYNPNHTRGKMTPNADDAAVNVSFYDAVGYCEWYSNITQKAFRLPTEMEWEYACRGDCTDQYYWGSSADNFGQFACDAQETGDALPPLETLKPNNFGLYDMLGTVWEWTSSMYKPYPIEPNDGRDILSGSETRVVRGGSYLTDRSHIGSGVRGERDPSASASDIGFRIVRSLR